MKRLPAALVVIDVCNELNAVREANKLNIPIVAIVDTNGDRRWSTTPSLRMTTR